MTRVLVILIICLCLKCFNARPSKQQEKKEQKKYVIEVQDHQQAMKYADPMVDLEETVRRGINDPLNDPNFIMNQVNEDFFHRNFAHDTSLYGGARPRQTIQTSMHSSARVFDLTPQHALADNAVKNNLMARHSSPYAHLIPKRPAQENAGKLGSIPHPASLINALKNLLMVKNNNKINNLRFFANNNNNNNNIANHDLNRVNPLTGLPEDLESKSYGSITSIESVSDQPENQIPQSVTVNVNSAAVRQQKPAIGRRRGLTNHSKKPKQSVSPSANLIDSTIGSNYDSIQSFLEADNILRKKLVENENQNLS